MDDNDDEAHDYGSSENEDRSVELINERYYHKYTGSDKKDLFRREKDYRKKLFVKKRSIFKKIARKLNRLFNYPSTSIFVKFKFYSFTK